MRGAIVRLSRNEGCRNEGVSFCGCKNKGFE